MKTKTKPDTVHLQFGLSAAVPPTAKAAWGARLIWPAELLYDRQGFYRWDTLDGQRLKSWLNDDGNLHRALDAAGRMARRFELAASDNRGVTLYEDETGIVLGNPLASFGYLYVAAYLKEETHDDQN